MNKKHIDDAVQTAENATEATEATKTAAALAVDNAVEAMIEQTEQLDALEDAEDTEAWEADATTAADSAEETVVEDLSEAYFRARHEPHRRLIRRYKPQISQQELDELKVKALDNYIYQKMDVADKINYITGRDNGLFTAKDLERLQAAELRQRARRAKKQELWSAASRQD